MREDAPTKARRYLTEGRIIVTGVGTETITALCRGDGVVYQLGWNATDDWLCDCKAMSPRCSHLLALKLVCIATKPHPDKHTETAIT